jgi:hypothetical protein
MIRQVLRGLLYGFIPGDSVFISQLTLAVGKK